MDHPGLVPLVAEGTGSCCTVEVAHRVEEDTRTTEMGQCVKTAEEVLAAYEGSASAELESGTVSPDAALTVVSEEAVTTTNEVVDKVEVDSGKIHSC